MKTLKLMMLLFLIGCNSEEKDLTIENARLTKQLDSIKQVNAKEEAEKKFFGEYINQKKGLYKSFDFKGESSVVITDGIIGLPYATSYVKDGDIIRIKTDKSDLLVTITDSNTLTGEGFADGIYIKTK